MDAAVTAHPTDKTLRDYGLGRLNDQVAQGVSRHVDGCLDCQQRVAGLSSDSFLGRLRQAQSSEGAAAGRTTPVGSPFSGDAAHPAAPPWAGAFPAELAENSDYEIVRELSGGGMGRVFVAHNKIMGRDEVLKIIGPDIIERPGVRDRFHREIRAVARLRHPNIVTAYAAFRAGASFVFAMEYVNGLDLARMVKAKGPMPVGHACYFIHQAALGLQHADQAGMVHRDIKPGNLMLAHEEGRAVIKVLDFGLAKAGREEGVLDLGPSVAGRELKAAGDLTLAGQMLGTPDFIAPEQIVDAQGADIRADIYSLGCTLYYLLSGRPPFQARKLADVLQGHNSTEALPVNLARPEVPVELAALVAKMMAKKPDQRLQTPGEVAQALAPFFKKRSAGSESPNFGAFPVVAPDFGITAAEATGAGKYAIADPATATAAGREPGMWSSLSEFKQTEEDPNGVSVAANPMGQRPRWLRPAVVAAFAAIALIVITFIARGRPKPVNGRAEILVAREPGGTPVEKAASIERVTESPAQPVDSPKVAPDIPPAKQEDEPPAPAPRRTVPPAEANEVKPASEAPTRPKVVPDKKKAVQSVETAAVTADQTPEEVLRSRRLTKSGARYVLDAEADFLEKCARVQPLYGELLALYKNLLLIMQYQNRYDELDFEYKSVRTDLRNVHAAQEAFPPGTNTNIRKQEWAELLEWERQLNVQLNALDTELDLMFKNLVPDWKKQKLSDEFQKRREEFLKETQEPRALADKIKEKYGELSKDRAVNKALDALRLLTKATLNLGPTPEFGKKSTQLKNAEAELSPKNFARKSTGKKVQKPRTERKTKDARNAGRAIPAGKGKMGDGPN